MDASKLLVVQFAPLFTEHTQNYLPVNRTPWAEAAMDKLFMTVRNLPASTKSIVTTPIFATLPVNGIYGTQGDVSRNADERIKRYDIQTCCLFLLVVFEHISGHLGNSFLQDLRSDDLDLIAITKNPPYYFL